MSDLCLFSETDKPAKGSTSPSLETNDELKKSSPQVSLVKLSRSGLLLFSFHDNEFRQNVVDMLSDIFLSLRSGKLKSPRSVFNIIILSLAKKTVKAIYQRGIIINLLINRWCHRLFPIQETCTLSEKELDRVVSKLFSKYLEKWDKLSEPIKVL